MYPGDFPGYVPWGEADPDPDEGTEVRQWLYESPFPRGAVIHALNRTCAAREAAGGTTIATGRPAWVTCEECLTDAAFWRIDLEWRSK